MAGIRAKCLGCSISTTRADPAPAVVATRLKQSLANRSMNLTNTDDSPIPAFHAGKRTNGRPKYRSLYKKPRFRVVDDPGPHPMASERLLSHYEVQSGLRFNSFTDGTLIEDTIAGSMHIVYIEHVLVEAPDGKGTISYPRSIFYPRHPLVNPRFYTEDGKFIP